MPITIRPSPEEVGKNRDATVSSERDLLSALLGSWEKDVRRLDPSKTRVNKPILHSSFKDPLSDPIIPYAR
jgi:hypothetical protein